jgi:hypothetical protein
VGCGSYQIYWCAFKQVLAQSSDGCAIVRDILVGGLDPSSSRWGGLGSLVVPDQLRVPSLTGLLVALNQRKVAVLRTCFCSHVMDVWWC